MIDINVFDDWVSDYDVSQHSVEIMEALIRTYTAMRRILPTETLNAIHEALREMDADAWERAYSQYSKRLEETEALAPEDFLASTISKIDNLNFEFGAFANAIFCYASSGMVENAQTSTPIAQQRKQIADWIERGRGIVDSIPAELHPLSFFRIIVAGAEGRWALDHGKDLYPDQIAALSAMVRYPGDTVICKYEGVRKTVQNLISEASTKSGDTTFHITSNRMITADSALAWLRPQKPDYFPSPWQIPETNDTDAPETPRDFVMVPVTFAYQKHDERPFTPNARCSEGYIIGQKSELVEDYWAALEKLTTMVHPRFKYPELPNYIGTLPCQDKWARILRTDIEEQINNQLAPAQISPETLQYMSVIEQDGRFRTHSKGHSAKLQRYECRSDRAKALALELRKGKPNVYVALRDIADHPEIPIARTLGAAPTGRNSNLNTMDQFKDTELAVIRPIDEYHLRQALDVLAS